MMRSFDDAEEDFQRFLGPPVIDAKTEKKGKFLENASQSKWKMFLFFVFGCIPVIHEKEKVYFRPLKEGLIFSTFLEVFLC